MRIMNRMHYLLFALTMFLIAGLFVFLMRAPMEVVQNAVDERNAIIEESLDIMDGEIPAASPFDEPKE